MASLSTPATAPATPPASTSKPAPPAGGKRFRTPTVLQMEAVECGAAALGIILAYHGRFVPLEQLRVACGVSRDGSKAVNVVKAAREYGLVAKGFRKEGLEEIAELPLPAIIFWNFNHFLVLEGYRNDRVYLNDPGTGPRTVTFEEFDQAFTGVVLTFEPGPQFQRGGDTQGVVAALRRRMTGNGQALIFVVLASLALVLPGLVVPVFSKVFVDEFLIQGRDDWIKPLLLGMVLTALLRAALTWVQQHYLLRLETKLSLTSASQFFWHVLRLPVVFFTQRHSGEISTRVALNDQVAQLLSGQLATHILGLVTITFYLLVMLQYSGWLTLLSIVIATLNFIIFRQISRRRKDANQRLLQEQGKLMGTTMSGLQMIETLKATGAESDFFARWAGYHAKALNAQQRLGASNNLLTVAPVFLTAINNAIVLGTGGFLVMDGRLTLGMLVAFQSLMASFLEPVNRLVTLGSSVQNVEGGLKRLDDVLRYPVDASTAASGLATDIPKNLFKLSGQLELRNVTFGYSRLEPPLIENFSLVVKPGERVALVGSTGCGKSTVSRLITGFYEPWEGQVLLDGKPRGEIPRAVLVNSLALVDQEIFLFEGTMRENLTLWDATVHEASLVQAAKDACIHDAIAERQSGYDSQVEESGRNFSGGQRQRIEIARALVNSPTLLVLDEATSALDPKTEKMIDENLRRRGCTCVIIAHRLSTIRDCDEIIVMDKGKIVQRGTHSQLVAQPGLYAELIKA
ncbi:MAG TPA: NHLP family bacteriocin export ABC transporter peptidase/permease/ATPase subunit [Verrucomicrobiae bacterium]|nr:NHLP family bacteriocin export ABC transporter peptidase/permease/ATPase subunit [Verrucomicrobiae bacterium]